MYVGVCNIISMGLKNAIISGTALAVSDVSYYPNEEVSACAWNVSTPDGKERIQEGESYLA